MDFLQLTDKSILIFGLANRKSVAWHIGRVLTEAGAKCVHVVQNENVLQNVSKLLGEQKIYFCDVEHDEQIARLHDELAAAAGFTAWSIRWPSPTTPMACGPSTKRCARPFCRQSTFPATRSWPCPMP